jgi:23S rRNA (adenine2503-C2)-methyltransferase
LTDKSRISIYDLSFPALEQTMLDIGEPRFRAAQIWRGIYGRLIQEPDGMSDIPRALRDELARCFVFSSLSETARQHSVDGHTVKWLFSLPSGNAIETVLMGYERRNTACISTQSGCAMGCQFCATGQMGFKENLSPGQVVEQVLYLMRHLKAADRVLSNIVVMGMGEPFHNYDATLQAMERLNDPSGLQFGARRLTISTVGIIPAIERFTAERRQINLAVSLHAATDDLRNRLVPVNRKYPLDPLFVACRNYVRHTRRRISFEWALIRDINDDPDQAAALAERLDGLLCHVNLIPLNPTPGFQGGATTRQRARDFAHILGGHGIPCTIRLHRGIDIQAGCGQLATERSQSKD